MLARRCARGRKNIQTVKPISINSIGEKIMSHLLDFVIKNFSELTIIDFLIIIFSISLSVMGVFTLLKNIYKQALIANNETIFA